MNSRIAACLALATLAHAAAAQLTTEQAAHTAIVLTPIGALPQVLRADRSADSLSRFEGQFRYGRWKYSDVSLVFQNIGGTALVRLARRVQLGGTVGYRTCDGCDGTVMFSGDAVVSLWRPRESRNAGGLTDLDVVLSAGIGKADTTALTARSVGAMLPLAVSLPQQHDGMVTLYVAPGIAYGYLTDDNGSVLGYPGSDGVTRAILEAGIGYVFRFGLGIHGAVHRVFVSDGPTQLGFAVSWRPAPSSRY